MARKPKGKDLPARPFLKWAGGKTQLLEALLEQVPEEFGTYYEPFVGGGALFFALREAGRIRSARLSDVNPELINVWTVVRDAPYDLIGLLEGLSKRTDEKDFYKIRAQSPEEMLPVERAARLLYLNKTCFNGLYRENSKGIFNVPYGRYARPTVLDRENLLAVSKALTRMKIEAMPFNKAVAHAKAGDFVYFDPPYYPVSKSASFTAYARAGFGDQESLQAPVITDSVSRCAPSAQ
jgi:DNA adenine methylase